MKSQVKLILLILLTSCSMINDFFDDTLDIKKPGTQNLDLVIKDIGTLKVIQLAKQNKQGSDSLIETRVLLQNIRSGGINNLKFTFLVFSDDTRSLENLLFSQTFSEISLAEFSTSESRLISQSLPFLEISNLEVRVNQLNSSNSFLTGFYDGFLNLMDGDSLVATGKALMVVDRDGMVDAYYKKESDFRQIRGQMNRDSLFLGQAFGRDNAILNLRGNPGDVEINGDTVRLEFKQLNSSRNEKLLFDLIKVL